MSKQNVSPEILWMGRQFLGVRVYMNSAEIASRLRVEANRFHMETGAFSGRPDILAAFESNDAAAFAKATGIALPDMVKVPRELLDDLMRQIERSNLTATMINSMLVSSL